VLNLLFIFDFYEVWLTCYELSSEFIGNWRLWELDEDHGIWL